MEKLLILLSNWLLENLGQRRRTKLENLDRIQEYHIAPSN